MLQAQKHAVGIFVSHVFIVGVAVTDAESGTYRALAVPFRPETYRSLLYLALSFPLGLIAFVGLVTGVSLGSGLAVTLVGIPILLATLVGAAVGARIEAGLVTHLVGVPAAGPSILAEFVTDKRVVLPGDGVVDAASRILTDVSTWAAVVLLLTKFVTGIVSFVALVTATAVCAVTVGAPLLYQSAEMNIAASATAGADGAYTIGPWVIDTLPEALAVSAGGVVLTVVALNLLYGFARLQAQYTVRLLGSGERQQ